MAIPSHTTMSVSEVVFQALKLVIESLRSHLHLLAWHKTVRSVRTGPLGIGAVSYRRHVFKGSGDGKHLVLRSRMLSHLDWRMMCRSAGIREMVLLSSCLHLHVGIGIGIFILVIILVRLRRRTGIRCLVLACGGRPTSRTRGCVLMSSRDSMWGSLLTEVCVAGLLVRLMLC